MICFKSLRYSTNNIYSSECSVVLETYKRKSSKKYQIQIKKCYYIASQKHEYIKVRTLKNNKTEATCKIESYWREDAEQLAGLPETEDRSENL